MLIEDPRLADAMERQFRLDMARSREVIRRPARGPQRMSAALPTVLRREEPEIGPGRTTPARASAVGGRRWPCAR